MTSNETSLRFDKEVIMSRCGSKCCRDVTCPINLHLAAHSWGFHYSTTSELWNYSSMWFMWQRGYGKTTDVYIRPQELCWHSPHCSDTYRWFPVHRSVSIETPTRKGPIVVAVGDFRLPSFTDIRENWQQLWPTEFSHISFCCFASLGLW